MRPISPIGKTLTGNKGFTLLEVIVVIVLVAAVSALVWPEMHRSIRRIGGKSAVHQVQRDLELLSDEAKGTSLPVKVIFTHGSGTYRLKWGDKEIDRPLQGLVFQGGNTVVLTHSPVGTWVGPAELAFRDNDGREFIIATGAEALQSHGVDGSEQDDEGFVEENEEDSYVYPPQSDEVDLSEGYFQ